MGWLPEPRAYSPVKSILVDTDRARVLNILLSRLSRQSWKGAFFMFNVPYIKQKFQKLFNVRLTFGINSSIIKVQKGEEKERIKMEPTWFEIIGFGIFVIGTWWALFKAVAAVADAEERRRENSDWEEL